MADNPNGRLRGEEIAAASLAAAATRSAVAMKQKRDGGASSSRSRGLSVVGTSIVFAVVLIAMLALMIRFG